MLVIKSQEIFVWQFSLENISPTQKPFIAKIGIIMVHSADLLVICTKLKSHLYVCQSVYASTLSTILIEMDLLVEMNVVLLRITEFNFISLT